jgi:hypothetical protein
MPLTNASGQGNNTKNISRMPLLSNHRVLVVPLLTAACLLGACAADRESAAWKPLFDGRTTAGWRGYGRPDFPKQGWTVENGCLHLSASGGSGGDIITVEQFTDFELQWEWRIGPDGNNGVKYLVTEARTSSPGHEYQMIDDAILPDPKHQTASFYDVLPPQTKPRVNPPGTWNESRIVIRGPHVEHWLNGDKVLAYELGSPEVQAAIAKSKFKDARGFGEKIKGPILLTNHHRETWFRNIRIRELSATGR